MHKYSHHIEQYSRSISVRAKRFFRSNFLIRNNAGHTRRVRFGLLIPAVVVMLWLVYVVNSFLFRLAFGTKEAREAVQRHTIDRGNLTALDLRPTEGAGMATAILLSWQRMESLQMIVTHLCAHDMFKEIMIWNNNVKVHIEEKVIFVPWFFDTLMVLGTLDPQDS